MLKRLVLGLASILLLAGATIALPRLALRMAERSLMVLRPNGPERPDDFGAHSQTIWFESHGRRLEASVVPSRPACIGQPVSLLLFHGRGETISMWARAQAFLAQQCVGSMVFDYSGHGASTPPAHVWTLNQDASAAYGEFLRRYPGPGRHCVMGHSMGNAPMLAAYGTFQPVPDCVVVANAFSSVQDEARASGAPAIMAALLSGVWDNKRRLREVHVPLLLVHSDSDQTIPSGMPRLLADAAPASALRITLHGFTHDALYEEPSMAWWGEILGFIQRTPASPG